jgi:hypothetical protein
MTIESEGIDFERDSAILTELYGQIEEGHWQLDLHRSYEGIAATASLPEHVSKQFRFGSPEECKRQVLQLVGDEMQRLIRFQDDRKAMDSRRMKLGFLRRSVPESATLDRYATTLERSFDRVLSRLDRAQRTRLGAGDSPG